MKRLPILVAVLALAASPLVAAQSTTVPTDDVGHTGTDTATTGTTIPTDDVGHTGTDTATTGTTIPTDNVGNTGTDTATTGTGVISTDGVGNTGTDTVTMSSAPRPALSLQPASTSLVGGGSMKVTAVMSASASATTETKYTYTVALASSDPACTVPASVDVVWSSTQGGLASFAVTCAKVTSNRTVTLSSGSATASFTLTRR